MLQDVSAAWRSAFDPVDFAKYMPGGALLHFLIAPDLEMRIAPGPHVSPTFKGNDRHEDHHCESSFARRTLH